MCGKNLNNSKLVSKKPGSLPRVREKLATIAPDVSSSRITPACAGKTTRFVLSLWNWQDHSRVCGKNHFTTTAASQSLWITPACAGKTQRRSNDVGRAWDHSRVCGKNFYKSYKRYEELGSLPRVREKH